MQSVSELRRTLEENLPVMVARHELKKYGFPLSPAHMANLDSKGQGPVGAITLGRRVVYLRGALIDWILARSTAKVREAR